MIVIFTDSSPDTPAVPDGHCHDCCAPLSAGLLLCPFCEEDAASDSAKGYCFRCGDYLGNAAKANYCDQCGCPLRASIKSS